MGDPYFDASGKGRWRFKWWTGKAWKPETLGPHPKPWKKDSPPKKCPPEYELVVRKYRDLETQARHGVDVAPTRAQLLADALNEYAAAREVGWARTTAKIFRRTADLFVAHCAAHGVTTMKAVKPDHCRSFLADRVRAGKSWGTLNAERGNLAPAWAAALKDGKVTSNPWIGAPVPIRRRQEEPPYWTREELPRLVAACRGWSRDVVLLAANCGLRITALLSLEWRDVSFERGVIVARAGTSKTARRYEVPMSATANEVLARRLIAREPGNALVLPGPRSGKPVDSERAYKRIRAAARRAGLPEKGHYNHILRHTFAAHAVMAGVPLYIVSAWLGHRSIKMTERYSHLAPSESHRQMEEKFDLPASPPTVGTPPQPARDQFPAGG